MTWKEKNMFTVAGNHEFKETVSIISYSRLWTNEKQNFTPEPTFYLIQEFKNIKSSNEQSNMMAIWL